MNRIYELTPLKGVGLISFGMKREDTQCETEFSRQILEKSVDGEALLNPYDSSTFQVFFDENETVEDIELSSGGDIPVIYKGMSVFEMPATELIQVISEDTPYDENDSELGYSYIFPLLELSVWRPVIPDSPDDEDGQYFSTIGIGRKGYYSKIVV